MDNDFVNLLISSLSDEQIKQLVAIYILRKRLVNKVPKKKLGYRRDIQSLINKKIKSIISEYTSIDVSHYIDDIAYAIKHLIWLKDNDRYISRDLIEKAAEDIGNAIINIVDAILLSHE
jgi:hypothetical protein